MTAEQEQQIRRSIFREAFDAFVILRPLDLRIVDVNPSVQRLTKYRRKELLDFTLSDLIHSNIMGDLDPIIHACQTTSFHTSEEEYSLRHRDGHSTPIHITVSRIHVEPEPLALLVLRDISKQKQTELILQETTLRLKESQSIARLGTFYWDVVRDKVTWSEELYHIYGLPVSSPLDLNTYMDMVHPQDKHRIGKGIQLLLSDQQPLEHDYRIIRPNGEIRWVHARVACSTNSQEEVIALQGTCQDITERKLTEEEAKREHQQLQGILDQLPAMVWSIDTNLIITSSLGSGLKKIGLEPNQLVGMLLTDYLQSEDKEFLPLAMHYRALSGESVNYEMNWQGEDFQVHIDPLHDSQGAVIGCVGISINITARKKEEAERRKMEAQLRHTQKLESLGVLAGGIAHDFNNLLMGILGNADLALRELSPTSPARTLIANSMEAARRAADLTQQMLAYTGKSRTDYELLNLSDVTREMTRLLQVSVSKKCELKFSLSQNLPRINADATQMRQIIMNLLINASEAIGEDNGIIHVITGSRHYDRDELANTYLNDELSEGEYVFLEVIDTGCGMSEETLTNIFDPFFTTKFTGRGLGLSAVLGIIRGHDGAIRIESEETKGTTFRVLFPASTAREESQNKTPNSPDDAWCGKGMVLVVDDELPVLETTRLMFASLGFEVLTAENGQEAVSVLREHQEKISLVLLDLTMPILDGKETYAKLRIIRDDIAVIFTSGYKQTNAASVPESDPFLFLQKPYTFEQLRAKVREVIEQTSISEPE